MYKTLYARDGSSTYKADLNRNAYYRTWYGSTKRYPITMCYEDYSNNGPIFHFRVIRGASTPRYYCTIPFDFNYGVGGGRMEMAYTRTNAMITALLGSYHGNNPDNKNNWVTVQEHLKSRRIDVMLRVDCQANGGGWPNNCAGLDNAVGPKESSRLCRLATDGIEHYWSGRVSAFGMGRTVTVRTIETSRNPTKNMDICNRGNAFNDGTSCMRSWNPEIISDMKLWYNRGCLASRTVADQDFSNYTAPHEIGHSFLDAWAGHAHSHTHKGTSTWGGGISSSTPACPKTWTLDMMKYYINMPCPSEINRTKVIDWDRAKMLMTAERYMLLQD